MPAARSAFRMAMLMSSEHSAGRSRGRLSQNNNWNSARRPRILPTAPVPGPSAPAGIDQDALLKDAPTSSTSLS